MVPSIVSRRTTSRFHGARPLYPPVRRPAAEKKKELHALRSRKARTLQDLMGALFTAPGATLRPSTRNYWRGHKNNAEVPDSISARACNRMLAI